MRPRYEGSCSDRNVGWCTLESQPVYRPTWLRFSLPMVRCWNGFESWSGRLRGAKYVPCPALILNNSASASHLIENECNLGRQWQEGLGWRFTCYRAPYLEQELTWTVLDCVWNVMAHAQKPDFVFRRNERVQLNRQGHSSVDFWQSRCALQR